MRIITLLIALAFLMATTTPQVAAAAQTNKKVATLKNKSGFIKRK